MSENPIRVGIIGAGKNTRDRHIPGLKEQEGVELVAVCNRSQESSQRAAEQFGIERTADEWTDVVSADDIDAVVIGTWPYMHERISVAALEAGKHVMCEARMARNATEARRMLAASHARPHLVAQIVPSPFSLRVDKTIQKRLSEGYLGQVLAVQVIAGGDFLDPDAELHWRHNYGLSGMNIMSMGIWYEAMMRWVGTATKVMALGKTFVSMRKDGEGRLRPVRIPDHLDVIGDLACGAQMQMMISSVTGLAGPPSATLYGTDGTLRFTENRLFGGQKGDDELSEIEIDPDLEGGWRVEEEFVEAIRGREEISHTTFEDGMRYMEFTEGVNRSMASGKAVSLPLFCG